MDRIESEIQPMAPEMLSVVDVMEARRKQLIESGELQEPDIAGAEALELIRRYSEMGTALTRDDLKGRALRLTQVELEEIVEGGDWLEWFQDDWRTSFIARGEVVSTSEEINAEYTLIFPNELGLDSEYQEAVRVERTWIDRANIPSLQPLFEGIEDETIQRQLLLEFMGQ